MMESQEEMNVEQENIGIESYQGEYSENKEVE